MKHFIPWLVIWFGTERTPDFYINDVPYWTNKPEHYFMEHLDATEAYIHECRQFDKYSQEVGESLGGCCGCYDIEED